MARSCNFRPGDTVVVLSGPNEGAQGKVLRVQPKKDRVVVRGVNFVERHVRPSQQAKRGERILREAPLSLREVALLNPRTKQPVRAFEAVHRHARISPRKARRGERVLREAPLSLGAVALLNPQTGKPTRAFEAVHRHARISPRKARLVAALIRGRDANEALDLLRFTNKRACVFVNRVLESAIANADEKEANVSRLVVSESRVDEGPVIPRWRPKDRGRAHPIRKPTCHIIVAVQER